MGGELNRYENVLSRQCKKLEEEVEDGRNRRVKKEFLLLESGRRTIE